MYKFIRLMIILCSIFCPFIEGKYLTKGKDFKPDGNFILDIIQDSVDSSLCYLTSGKGISILDLDDNFSFNNIKVGYGSPSAIALMQDKSTLVMSMGKDTFVVDQNVFLSNGTGVNFAKISNPHQWISLPQPGIVSVQGISYDIASDTLGQVWMACFGQSLQKVDTRKASEFTQKEYENLKWKTICPDDKPWDPFKNDNHKLYAVHHSSKNKIFAGTAAGVNVLTDYSVPDSLYVWKNYNVYDGLASNFVTEIFSQPLNDSEIIWAICWDKGDVSFDYSGISYSLDGGETWQTVLKNVKAFDMYFNNEIIYVASEEGLYKSTSYNSGFEKYQIWAYSKLKDKYVKVQKTYSIFAYKKYLLVGTDIGLVVSKDNGNSWEVLRAYKIPNQQTSKKTYAYPNPISPARGYESNIIFTVDKASTVSVDIFNFAMEKVTNICKSRFFVKGDHSVIWKGRDDQGEIVANGVYFYRVSVGGHKYWNKIMVFD